MKPLTFTNNKGDFKLSQIGNISSLYFPLASEVGLKSAVTPNLGGDSKINQKTFLLEPVSVDDLHNNRSTRNFWVRDDKGNVYSATGASAYQETLRFSNQEEENTVEAGFMWHNIERKAANLPLKSTITSFVPHDENVEVMLVTLENLSDTEQTLTAYGAVPIFGRSADNIRDHRNVTSMLHRIKTTDAGVLVCPTMSFDERGHQLNHQIYYVLGFDNNGKTPETFYPTVEMFIGEGGTFTHPVAIYKETSGVASNSRIDGREAMGAFKFETFTLAAGQSKTFILLMGINENQEHIQAVAQKYKNLATVEKSLEETKDYWQEKVGVDFKTGDSDFDGYMKWVCFQPFLRRLFGCSFLPHHDYGRGGRGWRDLWQDCLSLLLMEPKTVGDMIVNNYKGVRLDGTNATIIGEGDGNFLADRNGITRVWMDHALWPLMTTKLYIDQTGDIDILTKEISYFKDPHVKRGTEIDQDWNDAYGNEQRTSDGAIYTGSILEHLLIQHLTGFYEVGKHNIYRLRGADWNDALDMADENGESVAFTAAYSGNLMELASLVRLLKSETNTEYVEILEEIGLLLKKDSDIYDNIERKHQILDTYTSQCLHNVKGRKIRISLSELALNLIQKASWLRQHLQQQEWLDFNDQEGGYNSYYDNSGKPTDGFYNDCIHMMLTGQVFPIMNYVATDEQIRKITASADHYLYRPEIGGYRLNTDFKEIKTDLGRMFGFAYGEKENGAVFSHMTVMYANALYRRGFAKEGWKALKTLSDTALNFETSRIYPGIPEYFRADGRGVYHYLTGAASWYMLTMVTESFGVHGKAGDLVLYPKLLSEQFDGQGRASITTQFADKTFQIHYDNPNQKDFGKYIIKKATCDNKEIDITDDAFAFITKADLANLNDEVHEIIITLD